MRYETIYLYREREREREQHSVNRVRLKRNCTIVTL